MITMNDLPQDQLLPRLQATVYTLAVLIINQNK